MKSWRPGSGGSDSVSGPDDRTAGPGPGKHTLTESLEPVRRSSTDAPAQAAGSTGDTGVVGPQGGTAPSEPLSGRLHAPGCREHRVVTSSDATTTRAEARAVIATQNGVTEAALTAANPGVNWAALAANQIIIIPRH